MSLKKRANKALAFGLALSLVMGSVAPMGVRAEESVSGNSVAVEEVVAEDAADKVAVIDVSAEKESAGDEISVDTEGKTINLQGSSVVIAAHTDGTAIYLDANQDGVADSDAALYSGNLSAYTIYGIKDMNTNQTVCITMNGGAISKMYGAYNANITADGHGLEIYINAGTVTNGLEVLYGSKVTGLVKVMEYIGLNKKVDGTVAKTKSGGYMQRTNNGQIQFYGKYVLDEDIEIALVLVYNDCELIIAQGAELKVTNYIQMASDSKTYVQGKLNVNSFYSSDSYKGIAIVQGGQLTGSTSSSYLYYPIAVSANRDNVSWSFTNSLSLTENGVETLYLNAGATSVATIEMLEGYDCYYVLNEAEPKKAENGSAKITVPSEVMNLQINYVAKQISVNKNGADPVAIVNTTYTAESPLYDLSTLEIVDDTTAAYGGAVSYSLKEGSVLPKGLSFDGTKIVGTPTAVDMTGSAVTFEVTGRNGTKTEVVIKVKVAAEGYAPKNINDLVNVDGGTIDLQGTSVVIVPVSNDYSQIYLDEDHDKVPDNDIALLINGADRYNLSNYYTIYGYRATDKPFKGDISIAVKGGYVYRVYGVKGDDSNQRAVVEGDVTLSFENCYSNEKNAEIYGVCYGKANNVSLSVTSGAHFYTDFYGAYESTLAEDLSYVVGDKVQVRGRSGTVEWAHRVFFYPAYNSAIGGDVNQKLGLASSDYAITNPDYCFYYGVHNTQVTGNVNCTTDGYWNTSVVKMVAGQSTVGEDVILEHITGTWNKALTVVEDSTVTGDVRVSAREGASLPRNTAYILSSSSAKNVFVNIPDTCTEFINATLYYGNGSEVENVTYIYDQGDLTIGGSYVINEDIKAANVTIQENAEVTIAKNKTLDLDGKIFVNSNAKLINKGTLDINITEYSYSKSTITGTLDNYGTMVTGGTDNANCYLIIAATGTAINRDGGTWTLNHYVQNNGKIVNYGSFVQTCSDVNYDYKLGTVYSTKELSLNRDPLLYTVYFGDSTFYYLVTVDYVKYYTDSVIVSGDAVSTSGVEGDTNQYVQVAAAGAETPVFVVTPGNNTYDNIVPKTVTFGPEQASSAAEQPNGEWRGVAAGIFEPFIVTLNYKPNDDTSEITLDTSSARIENTEDEKPLMVDREYTSADPLYDLTAIAIENDSQETEGEVVYSVDRLSSLPDGLTFENGKLYGTFITATNQEKTIKFIVKGKNNTCAFFTLTLGAVEPAVPEFKGISSIAGICGDTLQEIGLPSVNAGSYQWITDGETVAKNGQIYQVGFVPEDTANYDWTQIEGWDAQGGYVKVSVVANLEHAWDKGTVAKVPTTAQAGVMKYTCVCGATRTETIAKLPGTSGGQANAGNTSGSSAQPSPKSKVGYTMSDKTSKAVYKVSSTDFEVTFVKPEKKTLTKVTIPSTITYEGATYKVTAIADGAFKNNKKLKTVKIGSNVKAIGKSAFQGCAELKSLTIPASVESIGSKAFYGCKKLTKLTIKTDKLTTSNVGKNAFKKMGSSNYKKVKVKVPKAVLKAYKKTLVKRGLSKKAKIKK